MELCDIRTIKELQGRYCTRTRKSLGQNFLVDPEIPRRTARTAALADTALEIGPGIGCLTAELAGVFPRVVAVEIDESLIPVLGETLADKKNVTVINADFMKTDLAALTEDLGSVSVCANLPYYITTPILMRLIESDIRFASIVVMVQKEVAERFTAAPGSAEYGAVTVALAAYGSVEKVMPVPRNCFYPAPNVDSAVIRITPFGEPLYGNDREGFRKTVKAAFSQRRKKLSNSLTAAFPGLDREYAEKVIVSLGFPSDVRGERLSPEDYVKLANQLKIQ